MDPRFLRSITTFSVLLLAVVLIHISTTSLSSWLGTSLRDQASSAGAKLEFEKLDLNFPLNAELDRVEAQVPIDVRGLRLNMMGLPLQTVPLPLSFEHVSTRVRLLPLLLLGSTVDFALEGYGGTTSGVFHRSLFSASGNLEVSADALQLGMYHGAAAAGLNGLLGFKFSGDIPFGAEGTEQLDLTLSRGSYKGGQVVLVQVPPVSGINLRLTAEQRDRKIEISKCALSSSLGSFNCAGSFVLNKQGLIDEQNFNADIALTSLGLKSLGGWMNMLANLPPDQSNPNWHISATKAKGTPPVVKFTAKSL